MLIYPNELSSEPKWNVYELTSILGQVAPGDWINTQGEDSDFSLNYPDFQAYSCLIGPYKIELRQQRPGLVSGRKSDNFHLIIKNDRESNVTLEMRSDVGAYALYNAIERYLTTSGTQLETRLETFITAYLSGW
jgi:hypothetical protein